MADLGGDGRVIGLAAAVRRAGERLLDDDTTGITLVDEATPATVPTRRR